MNFGWVFGTVFHFLVFVQGFSAFFGFSVGVFLAFPRVFYRGSLFLCVCVGVFSAFSEVFLQQFSLFCSWCLFRGFLSVFL